MMERMSAEEFRKRFLDCESSAKTKPAKYRNTETVYNGVRYGSRSEARFAENLDVFQQNGFIKCWTRQVPFRLPGGSIHRVDFLVLDPDGKAFFWEVKGFEHPIGKLKRQQVEDLYRIKIHVYRGKK